MAIVKFAPCRKTQTVGGLHGAITYCCRPAKVAYQGRSLISGVNCVPQAALLAALHRVVEFDDPKLARALLGGLNPREDADKRRSPLFTAYNLGSGCCAGILIDAGEKLTREESEFLIRNGEQRTLNPPK